jgi:hypothetical protein
MSCWFEKLNTGGSVANCATDTSTRTREHLALMQSASDVSTNTFLAVNGRPSGRGEKLPFHKPHRCEQTAVVFVLVAKSRLHLLTLVFGGQTAQACANAWFQKLTNIRDTMHHHEHPRSLVAGYCR